jgi:hypothetical protein
VQLHAGSLVDVSDISDIADEVGKAQGGYVTTACAVAKGGNLRSAAYCSRTARHCPPRKISRPTGFLSQNAQFASVVPSDRNGSTAVIGIETRRLRMVFL